MNSALRETVLSMLSVGKFPHALLLFGNVGVGKKYAAREIASMILCTDTSGGQACGKCTSCILFKSGAHPDLIEAEHSGKRGGISVAEVRRICADASVAPNTSDAKVYLFLDSDAMEAASQNALLKIIEEPPENVYFIFTAQSKSVFLPTVLSRVVSIGVGECTRDECVKALGENGIDVALAESAYEIYGGNIGKCLSSFNDATAKKVRDTVVSLVDCIINGDEYGFLKTCHGIENDNETALRVIGEMISVIRDISLSRINPENSIGLYLKGSARLSDTLSYRAIIGLYEKLNSAYSDIKMNVSAKLTLNLLCSQIFA